MIYSVLNLAFGGGFERWVKEVTPRLVSQGYKVYVITTKAGDVKDPYTVNYLIRRGVHIVEVGNFNKPLTIPKLQYFKRIFNIAKKCDIIYFNNAFAGNDILIRFIKNLINIKILAGYHGIFPYLHVNSYLKRIYHLAFTKNISKSFDAHHVVNTYTKNILLSFGYKRVYYIPNGVDTLKFRPGRKEDKFTVLFVGRLDYYKGFDIFVRIVKYLNKYYRDEMKFIIVGKGPLSYLAERLSQYYRNVEWLGYVTEDVLVKTYQRAHVLVAPSRFGFEQFLFTSIEAQACGTPVIVSDIPGPRDNVVNGHTGFLIKPSIKTFAKYILFFKNAWEKGTYEKYSKNARMNALKYDWKIIIEKIKNMLKEVVES
jgi:glycosyltransferase involved in cell wall biosynthesis